MLKDIKNLTELYLYSKGLLPEGKPWGTFHNELVQNPSKDAIGLLADANPKDKCKYALFINVDTKDKSYEVRYKEFKNFVEIEKVDDWSSHLFWQGSGQRQSKGSRNSPHDYFKKGNFSTDDLIKPLQGILDDYCYTCKGKGKNKTYIENGPLFWNKNKKEESKWLKNIVIILNENKKEIEEQVKGKLSSMQANEDIFVGLIINDKPIGEYELFRRYLLFVRMRAGVEDGLKYFANKDIEFGLKEFIGICPSCIMKKPLLKLWHVPAELSFYQLEKKSFSSFEYSTIASFRLCQSCADLLFVFKQHLLEVMTIPLGGNQCLVLPSIKLIPTDQNEKRRLFDNLKRIWDPSSFLKIQPTEEGLLYRLAQLPSYATVSFIFGDYITKGKSQDVKRLDELNIIFPDVLPSRLSQISTAIQEANSQLDKMWSLAGKDGNCRWTVRDDFRLLQKLFYPSWDEDKTKKDKSKKYYKSRRRPEIERYLRAIFYGESITHDEIADDCCSNLVSAIRTTRTAKKDSDDRYAKDNYIGNLLSLSVFLEKLEIFPKVRKEDINMTEIAFEFKAMPELGKFIEMHPLFKDRQYLAPFFVGCLFAYAESLQKENSRLAAYNWLGTMALTYDDILNDIYHKVLNYITNKEKIISSPRLQELTKAIAHYDRGKCDNDRVALTALCHGWAVGRDFIYMKKQEPKQNNKGGGTSNE